VLLALLCIYNLLEETIASVSTTIVV